MCLDAVLTRERRSKPVADLHEMARNPTVRAQANTARFAARPKRVALGFAQRVPPFPAHDDVRPERERTGVDLGERLLERAATTVESHCLLRMAGEQAARSRLIVDHLPSEPRVDERGRALEQGVAVAAPLPFVLFLGDELGVKARLRGYQSFVTERRDPIGRDTIGDCHVPSATLCDGT